MRQVLAFSLSNFLKYNDFKQFSLESEIDTLGNSSIPHREPVVKISSSHLSKFWNNS